MSFLILSAEQAKQIRGESSPGHSLDPRELADGTFALPVEVLRDPNHAKVLSVLSKVPRLEAKNVDWKFKDI